MRVADDKKRSMTGRLDGIPRSKQIRTLEISSQGADVNHFRKVVTAD